MIRLHLHVDYRSEKRRRRRPNRLNPWHTRLGNWCHQRKWFIATVIALLAILAKLAK